jgi:hypothetical protein
MGIAIAAGARRRGHLLHPACRCTARGRADGRPLHELRQPRPDVQQLPVAYDGPGQAGQQVPL